MPALTEGCRARLSNPRSHPGPRLLRLCNSRSRETRRRLRARGSTAAQPARPRGTGLPPGGGAAGGGQAVVLDGRISRGDVDGYRGALVELWLLSLCDHIVTTQARTGPRPAVADRPGT